MRKDILGSLTCLCCGEPLLLWDEVLARDPNDATPVDYVMSGKLGCSLDDPCDIYPIENGIPLFTGMRWEE